MLPFSKLWPNNILTQANGANSLSVFTCLYSMKSDWIALPVWRIHRSDNYCIGTFFWSTHHAWYRPHDWHSSLRTSAFRIRCSLTYSTRTKHVTFTSHSYICVHISAAIMHKLALAPSERPAMNYNTNLINWSLEWPYWTTSRKRVCCRKAVSRHCIISVSQDSNGDVKQARKSERRKNIELI